MEISGDTIIFSSGRKAYANNGIVGISPDLDLHEGYDGTISDANLTKEDLIELAEFMILQWQRFKEMQSS